MAPLFRWLPLALLGASSVAAISTRLGERKTIGQVKREIGQRKAASLVKRDDTDPALLYPEYNFTVPIDHFHNESRYEPHSDGTFPLRYWFDASHYKPGGPVIVLQSGETDASSRLPYLQKGIVAQLSQATNGIGVILEHRYYGTSFPTPDLATKNLRFLTTQQAMADEAYFAQNIKFPGLEDHDLTSESTAWISYGGSYAGAFSAFLRVQYPDVFWGSISSSGVTKAIYDYWQYFEAIIEKAPQDCVETQRKFIHAFDEILLTKNDTDLPLQLKATFGLPNLTHNADFASVLVNPLGFWQSLNWDPEVGSLEFYNYCGNITSTEVIYPEQEPRRANASDIIAQGGYEATTALENQLLNMIGYIFGSYVAPCGRETADECLSAYNMAFYEQDSIADGSWRSWPYQYCTEWGFLQTGDTPPDELPIVSRLLTLEYESIICRAAFGINEPSNVEEANKYGGYDISYPRLAIIDGDWDPWKLATPHAFEAGARNRSSTLSEPFILIPESVHHWDENGLFPNQTTASLPPARIKKVQSEEATFVKAWMTEWNDEKDKKKHGHGHGHGHRHGWGWGWPWNWGWGQGVGWSRHHGGPPGRHGW